MDNGDRSGQIVRFGVFEADLQTGELRKNGSKVSLQGQPFQVCAILLDRSGELVTREELRDAVWPEDTFVDFDHALNTAVKKIRAALGDDADNPRFLETVPRRGYRFIAPLLPVSASELIPVAAVVSRPSLGRENPYRFFAIVGVLAVVLVVLGLAWKVVPWHRSDPYEPPEFQRLTFDFSDVDKARFTPDGASAVFSAISGSKRQLFTQRLDAQNSQTLGAPGSRLLSVSGSGDLAVQHGSSEPIPMGFEKRVQV